ncbi:unnamed protein product [Pocillopora meandrina]|uniref:Uncharacterized protein n=1 Tax=Pocillopora meandrina TaxID=46732 RepID=A0AAU9WYN9_9CNID|nr:unnamed protein product [Pocillopora meandrina]
MTVDGRHYTIEFLANLVVLDYKTLVLLLVKKTNASFMLGGRGVSVEFCFIYNAIRGCKCHDVAPDETCLDCLRSKCNIGRSTGIRDDLVFLLDEELCNIQLCALHMEMRNTEQLLASIGLLAYRVDSLAEANAALKNYGPESFHGNRISVKKKSDQQSAITKQNIYVSSMSGPTEREILQHLEEIVELALPLDKFKKPYEDVNTAKNLILNRVTFYQARVDVNIKADMESRLIQWQGKLDELHVFFKKLCKSRKKSLFTIHYFFSCVRSAFFDSIAP